MWEPVRILEHRRNFMQEVLIIAEGRGWDRTKMSNLHLYLWNTLVDIDNQVFDIYETTKDIKAANYLWEQKVENLRQWLSKVLGVNINYV